MAVSHLRWDPTSGCCSFAATGKAMFYQELFECLTCGLEAVCAVCAESCHAGHDVKARGLAGCAASPLQQEAGVAAPTGTPARLSARPRSSNDLKHVPLACTGDWGVHGAVLFFGGVVVQRRRRRGRGERRQPQQTHHHHQQQQRGRRGKKWPRQQGGRLPAERGSSKCG